MEIVILFGFLAAGILSGLIGGLLGLSGGVITVPCLSLLFYFLDFPPAYLMHLAIGTSLAAMVFTGIASTWAHQRHQAVMWEIAFSMLPGIFLGSFLGALVANFLTGIFLQILFGIFICFLGAFLILHKKKSKQKKRPDKVLYTWIGLGIGSFASLLGLGGGIFTVPLLISYRYPEQKAVGTSAAIGLSITLIAAVSYLYFGLNKIKLPNTLGYIYLPAFALVGIGTIIFAPIGAKLAHKMKGGLLRKIFAGTLIIIGILMVFN